MKIRLLLSLLIAGILSIQQAMAQDYIIIEDFEDTTEAIEPNNLTGGEAVPEDSVFTFMENPDPDEVNESDMVLRFRRANDGNPWGGFWTELPEPINMDTMKYVHYQVWKPLISPLKFKVEGSDETDDFEFESMEGQTVTEGWETITFHYPDAAGDYPIIAAMPDFVESTELENRSEDYIDIYIDNIILSNSEEAPQVSTSTEEHDQIPVQLALDQNYPNPFNPATNIGFELKSPQHVTLNVYDVQGKHITTLVNEYRSAGQHKVTFKAEGLPSGKYFYRLETSDRTITRVMTLAK